MKTVERFLFQTVCLLLIAISFAVALVAAFMVISMLIVWFKEGRLLSGDQKTLGVGFKWLSIATVSLGSIFWLHRKIIGKDARDASFKLVRSSGNSEKRVQYASETLFFSFLAIHLWALLPAVGVTKFPIIAGWLIFAFVCKHIHIAAHETGHLAAARLLGFDLAKIQIGTGPLLWSHRFRNGFLCEWRLWSGGCAIARPQRIEGFRVYQLLFVSAGPLADAVLLWSSYQVITCFYGSLSVAFAHEGAAGFIATVLFWWISLLAIGGLIPHEVWLGQRKVWTDGYWILKLLTASNAQIVELARLASLKELMKLFDSDSPQKVGTMFAAKELRAAVVNSFAFREQQARLKSPLLHRPAPVSGVPSEES